MVALVTLSQLYLKAILENQNPLHYIDGSFEFSIRISLALLVGRVALEEYYMHSQAMKTFLVYILCIFPLLTVGGPTAVLVPYGWKTEKLEHFLPANKSQNAADICVEASRSVIKHMDLQHHWVIEHFRDQEALQKLSPFRIQSAEFGSPDKKYKFRISLKNNEDGQRILALHSLTNNGPLSCKVQYDTISAKDGSLRNLTTKLIHLDKTKGDMQVLDWPLPSNLEEYIDNDGLIILCSITIYEQAGTICYSTPSDAGKSDNKAFVDSFKKLFESKTSADMDVNASDCVIPVHRSIFIARSPMMDSLIEKRGKRYFLDATQFSCDAMNCIVSYIYTDKCTLKPEIADEVLLAAHEYELPSLVQMAERQVIRSLDEKNIASRAKLAKKVGSTTLLRGISNYIIENQQVLNSDAWKKLEMEESCPSAFILREIFLPA